MIKELFWRFNVHSSIIWEKLIIKEIRWDNAWFVHASWCQRVGLIIMILHDIVLAVIITLCVQVRYLLLYSILLNIVIDYCEESWLYCTKTWSVIIWSSHRAKMGKGTKLKCIIRDVVVYTKDQRLTAHSLIRDVVYRSKVI